MLKEIRQVQQEELHLVKPSSSKPQTAQQHSSSVETPNKFSNGELHLGIEFYLSTN